MSIYSESRIGGEGENGNGLQTYLDENIEKAWKEGGTGSRETSPMLNHYDECPEAQKIKENDTDVINHRKIRYALGICIAFFFIELISGFLTHSLAIFSDSFHLLSDIAGFLVSLIAFHLSRRPATIRHSYGFYRIEVLGALGSTFMIWAMTGILVWEAIGRIRSPVEINAPLMFATASAGLIVNIIIGFVLNSRHGIVTGIYQEAHSHSHESTTQDSATKRSQVFFQRKQSLQDMGDDHTHQEHTKHSSANINIQSASIHVIGDIISSTGVLIASVVIMFYPRLVIIDPICTFIFSILVIFTTLKIIKNSLTILMEATPMGIDSSQVYNDLLSIKGVKDVHDLHIWNLTLGKPSLSVHLHIIDISLLLPDKPTIIFEKEYTRILTTAQNLACSKYGIHHVTVQIETDEYQTNSTSFDSNSQLKPDDIESSSIHSLKQEDQPQASPSKSNLFQRYRPHCDNAMCRVGMKKS